MFNPPVARVDVAVVDVALKFPNVGVEVAVTTPLLFRDNNELILVADRFRYGVTSEDSVAAPAFKVVADIPVFEIEPLVIVGFIIWVFVN